MTPPASILGPDRNRASAAAWGTLCVLVVVQMGIIAKLATTRSPALAPVPVPATPTTPASPQLAAAPAPLGIVPAASGGVPQIGQLATPPSLSFSPPLPGTLAAQPAAVIAAPVSNGPPPIGSFQHTPGPMTAPSVAPLIPSSTPVPALPGSSMPTPALPRLDESKPPLPGSSMPTPALPGSLESKPPLPGSSMPMPAMPGLDEGKPPLPGSSMPRPALPELDESKPPLPGSSMPVPSMPGAAEPKPALPGSSMPTPALPGAGASEPKPALPGSSMPTPQLPALVPQGSSSGQAPPSAPPQASAKTAAPAAPGSMPKPMPAKPSAAAQLMQDVNYVVTTAKEIRGLSDMQGALQLLQKAEQFNPDHPAIIAEIAQTYEQMGIKTKATDSWRRIQLLGETKAGSYYELAVRRLGAGPAAAAAASAVPGAPDVEGEKHLRLGACQVQRDFNASNGERYTLRVPILRASSQPVDGKMVNMEVFFFDRVNGGQVAQSIAPEPLETWQSSPVDWSGAGEETLDVVYHLPALSEAEIRQHGRRSYYGYMLRLYYNNKLQDVAAEPRDLLEFGSVPGATPAGGNPLLPPVGR